MDTNETHETAARLRRAITLLNRRLRNSSLGGITPAQASILAVIDNLGEPTLGEIAQAEQVQPPSVTRLVNQMESAGLITRHLDPEDRRLTRVALSAHGRKEIAGIRHRKTEFLERQISALGEHEQKHVGDLVVFLEALLESS